jgi:hypothetical protein
MSAPIAKSGAEHTLVVEVMAPRGARAIYGLLGARFVADPYSSAFKAVLSAGSEPRPVQANTLLGRIESVEVGLPEEYAQAVASSVRLACEDGRPASSGVLDIRYAAIGHVSSNQRVFSMLGNAIVQLMVQTRNAPKDADRAKVVAECYEKYCA